MKKSLIVLAIASAFAAQSAMADGVNLYGAANVSFDAISNGATANSASGNGLSSNASHFGLKGSEDLGGGLSAVFQIEEAVNFVSNGSNPVDGTTSNGNANGASVFAGNSTFQARDTFVGLSSGSFGTLIAGTHDTPYKMATRGYDLFADTIADNRSIMGTSGATLTVNGAPLNLGDIRVNDAVAYISPAMSGFTVAVAYVAGGEIPNSGSTKGDAWSLAGLYAGGPFSAGLAYQTITIGDSSATTTNGIGTGSLGLAGAGVNGLGCPNCLATNDKATMWKLGGGYTVDAFAVNAVYEKNSSSGPFGNALDRTSWYVSGKYNFTSSDTVKAAYTAANDINGAANTGVKQFSIGYDHGLSKHTTVYALYSKLTNDSSANYMLGNSDADSNTANSNGGVGSDPSVFSLGIKHAF